MRRRDLLMKSGPLWTFAAARYRETADSAALREKTTAEQKAARAQAQALPAGRPTKRDRRRLEDFLTEP